MLRVHGHKEVHSGFRCSDQNGHDGSMANPILALANLFDLQVAQDPKVGTQDQLSGERYRLRSFTGDVSFHFGDDLF